MRTPWRRVRFLFALLFGAAALIAAAAPAAQAQTSGGLISAWGVAVRFPGTPPQLEVVYYTYVMQNSTPPVVVRYTEDDISGDCDVHNAAQALSFDGAYAIFDGATYISCDLPAWRQRIATLNPALPAANNDVINCPAARGGKWAAADVRLDAVSSINPLVDASALGISFSLPTAPAASGIEARTRMILSSGQITSPPWPVDSAAGNRTLIGQGGPLIIAANDAFDRLSYLGGAWETPFEQVDSNTMGYWSEAPSRFAKKSPVGGYTLATTAEKIYIGHSPSNGSYLRGRVGAIDIDPGCFAG
jgi:hypothetical protein